MVDVENSESFKTHLRLVSFKETNKFTIKLENRPILKIILNS